MLAVILYIEGEASRARRDRPGPLLDFETEPDGVGGIYCEAGDVTLNSKAERIIFTRRENNLCVPYGAIRSFIGKEGEFLSGSN